jgi:ectoine hydroxylase-related dioxygenase (phytanoyl-CoA dioxygenase family)
MHPKVTQDIIETYNEVGVTHVVGAMTQEWVAGMTKVIDDAILGIRTGTISFGPQEMIPDIQYEDHDGYVRLVNLYQRLPEMRDLVEHSDCAQIVADVIGSDTMQPWTDGTFLKEGEDEATATPWHNDECLFPLRGHHAPSMWIALTDVDLNNAPVQTLSGSNKDSHRYVSSWALDGVKPPPNFHPWEELLERVHAPYADIRVWEVKAGDMLIIHPKTIHASLPRTAGQFGRRVAFSLRWLGSDIRYENNPTSKKSPFQNSPNIKEGEPLPAQLFPTTWRRNTENTAA